MIKFFRKIRYDLMEKNKTGKYFKYAIGEIILVVIGILIALQINNWNNERLSAREEKLLLENLKEEYQENLLNLNVAIKKRESQMKALNSLYDFVAGKLSVNETNKSIDSLIGVSRYIPTYESRSGALQEIINGGKLNIIQNRQLRKYLSNWSAEVDDLRKIETGVYDIILNNYNTYLIDNYTLTYSDYFIAQSLWKDIPMKETNWNGKKSNNKIDIQTILNDPKFESILSLVNLWAISSKISASELKNKTEIIIGLIDAEIIK
ncbi:DUF6090 family protein [Hanstruepera ponticola]|uniref:DUF6090 family protein n=1 Tax=Hanstruepera ponticola TaxID=2042995 RepID=UPI0013C42F0C|nr:DUF6090 family protein [Hanstruepera ponticola]